MTDTTKLADELERLRVAWLTGDSHALSMEAACIFQPVIRTYTGAPTNGRYTCVKDGFWWRIRIGTGTATYGRFYTKTEAERMAAVLLSEFRNGEFLAAIAKGTNHD